MKLFRLFFLLLLINCPSAFSQMFSQYIETNSGTEPKGVEIFNNTASAIDFSITPLEIFKGVNGGACGNDVTVSSGILNPGEVWVIGTADLVTYAQNNPTNLSGTTSKSFTFNGDDALELYIDGTLFDVIGTCGSDPGTSWSANGVSTANQNIAILNGICSGTTTYWTDPSLRFSTVSTDPVNDLTGFGTSPTCTSNTITTGTVSPLTFNVDCSTTDSGDVDFTSTGTFNTGNTFTAQLSDATGSFASPTNIGTLALDGTDPSGIIGFTIPSGTPNGTGYRIRVVSDDPYTEGTDNGTDIEIIYTPCPTPLPASGGLLINEFSNGSSGSQEFYEFIVGGQCGETVDVRGYIIDDNNGSFTDYSQAGTPGGTGIADGHLRLTNDAQWSNIPVGSVIVVYNAADPNGSLPPDDPSDSDNDSLYIIPHNNTVLFEIETQIPNATDPDSTYAPATYTGSAWSPLSIANGGDAVQVRQPDGTYFHGVSYGGVEITGGPDGTKILNGSMGGMNGIFHSGDFTDPANWSVGSAPGDETPGTFNNTQNEEWLKLMRDPDASTCPVEPLPVTLVLFDGEYKNEKVNLHWESSSEQNNDYYRVLHSTNGYDFSKIGTIKGSGSISHSVMYGMNHRNYKIGINYYKLQSVDYDGTVHEKGIIAVMVELDQVYYDNVSSQILFPNKDDYMIYDVSGKLVSKNPGKSSMLFNKKGMFFIVNNNTGESTKLIIQ